MPVSTSSSTPNLRNFGLFLFKRNSLLSGGISTIEVCEKAQASVYEKRIEETLL